MTKYLKKHFGIFSIAFVMGSLYSSQSSAQFFKLTVNGKPVGKHTASQSSNTSQANNQPNNSTKAKDGIVHNEITNDISLTTASDSKIIEMIKSRAKEIVEQLHYTNLNFSFDRADNFRVVKRDSADLPQLVRFNFVLSNLELNKRTYAYEKSYKGWSIDVGLNNGLPVTVAPGGHNIPHYITNFPFDNVQNNTEANFTDAQKSQIHALYSQYRKHYLDTNRSFQYVMKRLSSYPKEYDMHNCIGVERWTVSGQKLVEVKDFPHSKSLEGTHLALQDAAGLAPYYKNISNHTIVIKGIFTSDEKPDGAEFSEDSILLAPGQYFYVIQFQPTFTDESMVATQYLGDPGIIKDLGTKEN